MPCRYFRGGPVGGGTASAVTLGRKMHDGLQEEQAGKDAGVQLEKQRKWGGEVRG